MHYQRWRKFGDPHRKYGHVEIDLPEDNICIIDGCNKEIKIKWKGWCNKHYTRWQRHGDPNTVLNPRRDPICSLDGCNGEHKALGYCCKHYQRYKNHGDPHITNPNKMPEGEGAKNALLYNYKNQSKNRGYNWELEDREAIKLFEGDCYYCGTEPAQIWGRTTHHNGVYIYNGIDRKDNEKGYTPDNCVSSCGTCNISKNTMPAEEFISMCEQVANHQRSRHFPLAR